MKEVAKYAWIDAIGTALYVAIVALFIYFLGRSGISDVSFLIPTAMLMLFVFSAAFTGVLVFGRPIMWYLDGKKKEALSLIVYTLGIFLAITVIIFLTLIIFLG